MSEEYRIYYEGDFCAAFPNNAQTRDYVEGLLNDGGFFTENFKVTKTAEGQTVTLTVDSRHSVSIGGM